MENRFIYKLNTVLNFGKYKGKTVEEVCEVEPDYIIWALTKIPSFNLYAKDVEFIISNKLIRSQPGKEFLFHYINTLAKIKNCLPNEIEYAATMFYFRNELDIIENKIIKETPLKEKESDIDLECYDEENYGTSWQYIDVCNRTVYSDLYGGDSYNYDSHRDNYD
jgi:hypothetical protein